jgi:hypothetical protein
MNRWIRHRERSAAIHGGVLWCSWIAAACGLAMTDEGVFMESAARQSMTPIGTPPWIATACGLAMSAEPQNVPGYAPPSASTFCPVM